MLIAAITAELSLKARNSPHLGEKSKFSSVFWLNPQRQSLRLINVQSEGSSIERPVKTSNVAAGNQPTPADNEVLNLVDISASAEKRSTKGSVRKYRISSISKTLHPEDKRGSGGGVWT